MREALLVIILLILFGLGYVLMDKLDHFLLENRKSIEKGSEKVEPSRIMLTNQLSDEEILDEIRQFREAHGNIKILVYDDVDEKSKK